MYLKTYLNDLEKFRNGLGGMTFDEVVVSGDRFKEVKIKAGNNPEFPQYMMTYGSSIGGAEIIINLSKVGDPLIKAYFPYYGCGFIMGIKDGKAVYGTTAENVFRSKYRGNMKDSIVLAKETYNALNKLHGTKLPKCNP